MSRRGHDEPNREHQCESDGAHETVVVPSPLGRHGRQRFLGRPSRAAVTTGERSVLDVHLEAGSAEGFRDLQAVLPALGLEHEPDQRLAHV